MATDQSVSTGRGWKENGTKQQQKRGEKMHNNMMARICKVRWNYRLIQNISAWYERNYGKVDLLHHTITDWHGVFENYLYRIKKRSNSKFCKRKTVSNIIVFQRLNGDTKVARNDYSETKYIITFEIGTEEMMRMIETIWKVKK